MAESPLAKKAKDLLAARVSTVDELGKLLEEKRTKEAELAELVNSIDKAITQCLEAGWKPDELVQLGIPKPGKRRGPKAAAPASPPANPVPSPPPPSVP